MKHLKAYLLLLTATGCSHVEVSVNSMRDQAVVSRSTPIVFVKQSNDIESEKLRRECIRGAQSAGMIVLPECESNCFWVTVDGQTGVSKERMSSNYNSYTKKTETFSSNVTDRKIKVSVYADEELRKSAYQSIADSSGSNNNVLSVAKEMCEATFKAYPLEHSGTSYSILRN